MSNPIRVTVWGENIHERTHDAVRSVYPDGMHTVIASAVSEVLGDRAVVRTATLDQPEHGLTDEILAETDVMTWWGHMGHHLVDDAVVDKVVRRVHGGMGLLVLHSGHFAKVFKKLMGTTCALRWRDDDTETVWCVRPGHAITDGVPDVFQIPNQEMYGEFFDIPQPDELIFISSFGGGEVFRSGCCWTRGRGRIFYFSPGHETYPVYYQPEIRRIIANGVSWAAQNVPDGVKVGDCPNAPLGWFKKGEGSHG